MCRLLGFASRTPTAVRDILGAEGFHEFTALSELHGDGWGTAWSNGDGVHRYAAPVPAGSDPTYARLTAQPLGAAGLVHLRWATESMPVRRENTHPFVADGVAFMHNGGILPVSTLDGLLTVASRGALAGTTDSERYFRLVLQRAGRAGTLTGGVRDAVADLRAAFPHASLNAMILDAENLIVVHANSSAVPPLADIRARYPAVRDAPPDHGARYFQLRARIDDGAVMVASTGMRTPGWSDLQPDSLFVVARKDLSTRQIPLELTPAT